MSNPYYDLYVDSVIALARSLVIKDHASAVAINQNLQYYGHSVETATPTTWKYYKNIAGEYHSTDEPIIVRSVDTLEDIVFSKENLAAHPATAEEYRQGSDFYNRLISQYPQQELLIRGIVNPVDLQKAISAEDGSVLAWDSSQVESNETNLIPKIEQWAKSFYVRWNIPDYNLVDSFYASAFQGVLFSLVPQVIFNIRLENCKTNYVHSFHVRQYLASHGKLDVYLDRLNTKQALWLYRNVNYLLRHAGRTDTFHALVEHILTERGIALAAYDLRHNLSDILQELRPHPEMSLEFLNYDVGQDYRDVREIPEILDKEITVAPDNMEENDDAYGYVPRKASLSMTSSTPTKVLESIVSDNSNNTAFSLGQILLQHWIYLASEDRYVANVSFPHPVTGEVISLSAKEAFVAYLYVYNKACGLELTQVPDGTALTAVGVKRPVKPTLEQLKAVVDSRYVSEEDLQRSLVGHPPMSVYNNVTAFRDYCLRLRDLLRIHREIYILKEHPVERGQLEGALRMHWQDVECDLFSGENYVQWFVERGLDFHTLTDLDLRVLSAELLQAGTGSDLSDANALRDLQNAMVGIMERLSSYSVQYLKTITSNTFLHAEWASIRTGDIKERGNVSLEIRNSRFTVLEHSARGSDKIDSKLGTFMPYKKGESRVPATYFWEVMPEHKFHEMTYSRLRIPTSSVGVLKVTGENIYPPQQ